MTGVATGTLRERIADALFALGVSGLNEWLAADAVIAVLPEPEWEYRAASKVIKWYHRDTAEAARAGLAEVADSPADRWVERRRRAGEWERVDG